MPVTVVCPACKSKLKAPDTLIGKAVKCPGCGKPVLVKAAASAPAPAPAAAPKKPPVKLAPVIEEEPIEELEPVEDEVESPQPKKKKRPAEADGDEAGAPSPGGPTTDKERSTAMWIHLLPIVLGWCCGLGSWISLFMWISKRKESAFVDHHGKTWLNWVINLLVVGFLFGIISGVLQTIGGLSGSQTVALITTSLVGLLGFAMSITILVMQVMVALKAKKGEWAEYKVLFKVLK
ncbi:MAG TPA: DUF4870 domain-containing protein [Gemmataceae bacterium]|nr:DUF4870 domain-containing protein [Gemmataceae bacterium]